MTIPREASQGLEQEHQKPRGRVSWSRKFVDALRGMLVCIRGQSSFFVHFFFAALVVVAAVFLDCTLVEWALLLLCIGFVLTAELFNSAIETLFHGLDEEVRERCWRCLDIAAGAVLLASVCAAIVGTIIFGRHIIKLLFALSSVAE